MNDNDGPRADRRGIWRWLAGGAIGAAAVTTASPAEAAEIPLDRRIAKLLRKGGKANRAIARLLATEAANPTSALRAELAKVFAPVTAPALDPRTGAGLLPPSTAVLSWDDFGRSDRLLGGDRAPSGDQYRVGGLDTANLLRGRRYAPANVPRRADILYVDHDRPLATVAAGFVWDAGVTSGQNAVVGACDVGFGTRSIQLAAFASYYRPGGYDWSLFWVTNASGPYPSIASGRWRRGFEFVMDGTTEYRLVLQRTAERTVVVELPDGQLLTFTHDVIAQNWGDTSGVQLRRPALTDGYARFTAVATSS